MIGAASPGASLTLSAEMSASPWPDYYELPSSPVMICQDRFGLLDSDEYATALEVPFWPVLTALLTSSTASSVSDIIDILESIAVELRGTSQPDYNTLKSCLRNHKGKFLYAWPTIVKLALSMPHLFPEHRMPTLKEHGPTKRLDLTRRQAACLVAHQFLGTMAAPPWQTGFQNFDIWYQGEQPHSRAPTIYITAMLEYFDRVATAPSLLDYLDWKITYELVSETKSEHDPQAGDAQLGEIELVAMSDRTAEADFLGTYGDAVVISANKFIGFGRSATQEEVFVGATPDACPAVLITPPLEDHQALVVRGCEAMVKTVGQGRDIELAGTHSKAQTSQEYGQRWRDRTMLFMDALELDGSNEKEYPDAKRDNIEREYKKALAAFGSGRYTGIYTGLWGCGTFGGDPQVKMVILWLAASVSGATLTVIYGLDRHDFAKSMREFIAQVRASRCKISNLLGWLRAAEERRPTRGQFLTGKTLSD